MFSSNDQRQRTNKSIHFLCDSLIFHTILFFFPEILKNLNWNDIFFIAKNNKKRINEYFMCPENWSRNDHDFFFMVVSRYSKKSVPFIGPNKQKKKLRRSAKCEFCRNVIENKFALVFGSLSGKNKCRKKITYSFPPLLYKKSWEFEYGYKLVSVLFTERLLTKEKKETRI